MSKRAPKRSSQAAVNAATTFLGLNGAEPPLPPDDYKCACGYMKRPEKTVHPRLGEKIACMGCGGHPCSVCDKPIPRLGECAWIRPVYDGEKLVGKAALIYRRDGDKITCGACLKSW